MTEQRDYSRQIADGRERIKQLTELIDTLDLERKGLVEARAASWAALNRLEGMSMKPDSDPAGTKAELERVTAQLEARIRAAPKHSRTAAEARTMLDTLHERPLTDRQKLEIVAREDDEFDRNLQLKDAQQFVNPKTVRPKSD